MASSRKIFVTPDHQLQKRLYSPEAYSTDDPVYLKRGDTLRLLIGFINDEGVLSATGPGVSSGEAATTVVQVGVKPIDEFDLVTFLTYGTVTGIDADGYYIIDLDLNTEEINDLLMVDGDESNDVGSVEVMFEITWSVPGSGGGAKWQTCRRVNALIENDVIRGDEGTPTALPTPIDWLGDRVLIRSAALGRPVYPAPTITITGTLDDGTDPVVFPELVLQDYLNDELPVWVDESENYSLTYADNLPGGGGWVLAGPTATWSSVGATGFISPSLVTAWSALAPATGTPVLTFPVPEVQGDYLGQLCRVGDESQYEWFVWDGLGWYPMSEGSVYNVTDLTVLNLAELIPLSSEAQLAYQRFLEILEEGDLTSALVDALCTSSKMNDPSQLVTLKGVYANVDGTPDIGPHGINFRGDVSERAYFEIPDTRVFTVLCDAKSALGIAATPVYWQMANAAGLGTAGTLLHASGNGLVMTANAGGYANTEHAGGSDHAGFITIYNNTDQITAVSMDNAVAPTVKIYGNGRLLITDATGQNRATSAIDSMTLGAFSVDAATYQNPFKGSIRSVAIFNRVLTDAEVMVATRAIRVLDHRRRTLVTHGDSQTAQLNITTGNRYQHNWPLLYSQSREGLLNVRVCNAAVNALDAADALTNFDAWVGAFFPDGKHVTKAEIIFAFGTNDIFNGASAATMYTRNKAIADAARAAGFSSIGMCTVMHNTNFDSTQHTARATSNTSVREDQVSWDFVWDWDRLIGDDHNPRFWLDTLHMNYEGNVNLAANLAAGCVPNFTWFSDFSPTLTESTTARTLAVEDTGKYIRLTNAASCTITVPTDAAVPILIDSEIYFRIAAAGIPTITEGSGVTVNNKTALASMATHATFCLKKLTATTWDLI